MASKVLDIDEETFSCTICLDLLQNPVTIPCGHSYCMSCVNTHWNKKRGKHSYSCPQCKQSFTQRPVLMKNTMLASLMEGLKKSGAPAAPLCPPSAAHLDVSCDLCCERKMKAVKSCLQCLVSYCKDHLQPHYDVAALKRHKLVEPTENLQDNICSRHYELKKMFCRTEQQCICYLCAMDQHKGHHTVTAAAERTEKQRELQTFQQNILHIIELKQKDILSLQHQVKSSKDSADAAVEQSDRGLKELLAILEIRMSEVKQQLRFQQKAEERRVQELLDIVQQEISELLGKLTELDTLSHTEDHVHFLHKFATLSKVSEASNTVTNSQSPLPFQDIVTVAVSKLRRALQETSLEPPDAFPASAQTSKPSQQTSATNFLDQLLPNLNLQPATSDPQFLSPPTLLNLEDFELRDLLQYSRRLTFDPDSLNYKLELSKGDTKAKRLSFNHNYPPHPSRFTHSSQVMTKESLTGRCFWQVHANYEDGFGVAVSYRSIRREGPYFECDFGANDKSWLMECYSDHFDFRQDTYWKYNSLEEVERFPSPARIGIFLDYDAGIIAFYKIYLADDSVVPLYLVKTSFTEPLVAGVVLLDINSTAELL